MAHAKRRSLRNHHDGYHAPGDPLGEYLPPLEKWIVKGREYAWKHPSLPLVFYVKASRHPNRTEFVVRWTNISDPNLAGFAPEFLARGYAADTEEAYALLKKWYAGAEVFRQDGQTHVRSHNRVSRRSERNPDWPALRKKLSRYVSRPDDGAQGTGVTLFDIYTGKNIAVTEPTRAFHLVAEPYSLTIAQARTALGGEEPPAYSVESIEHEARTRADTDLFRGGPSDRVFVRVGREYHAVAVPTGSLTYRGAAQNPDWSAIRAKASHYGSRAAAGAREAYAYAAPRARRAAEVTWEGAKSAGRAVKRGAKRAAPVVARGARSAAEGLDRWSQTNGRCAMLNGTAQGRTIRVGNKRLGGHILRYSGHYGDAASRTGLAFYKREAIPLQDVRDALQDLKWMAGFDTLHGRAWQRGEKSVLATTIKGLEAVIARAK